MTYHQRKRSGSLIVCFQEAGRMGYELREQTESRVLMQYADKDYWATITETNDPRRPWELVVYKSRPTCKDPKPKEDFIKRAERESKNLKR